MSGSTPLLLSPSVTPNSPVAPLPWSPLPATPSWHALLPPCLWSSQVSASPPALACPDLPSLRRWVAARRSSLLLVSPDDCSHADSPHGRVRPSPVFLQLRERFRADLLVLRLYFDRGVFAPHLAMCPPLSGRHVDPVEPDEVAVDSGAAGRGATRGVEPVGLGPKGTEPPCTEPGVADSAGAEPGGAEPERAEAGGGELSGDEPERAEPGGVEPERTERGGTLSTGGPPSAPGGGGSAAGGTGAPGPGGTRAAGAKGVVGVGAGCTGAGASGGTGAARAGGAVGIGARDPGVAGTGGARAARGTGAAGGTGAGATGGTRAAGPGGACTRGTGTAGAGGAVGVGAGDHGAGDIGAGGAGRGECREPVFGPALPVHAVRTGRRVPRAHPPPVTGTHYMTLRHSSVPQRVPLPSPPESSLGDGPDLESDLVRAASSIIPHLLAIIVTDPSFESAAASALVAELVAACRLDYAASLVVESESDCPPSVGGDRTLRTDVLEDRQEDFECLAAARRLQVPTPLTGKLAMDAEMASWKSTRTSVDVVSPPGANIVDGMWIFMEKRPPGSPPAFKPHYVARGFSQQQGVDFFQTFSPTPKMTTLRVLLHVAAQRDYKLHSLDFSTTFLQAPQEWHDALRTTLAALRFAPSTANPSLFLRTDTSLPPFYVLVYVNDLFFATADTEALALVNSELQKRHTCTDLGELHSYLGLQITRDRARRTITLTQSHMILTRFCFVFSKVQLTPLPVDHGLTAPPSDEPFESSGPYPELVGCLILETGAISWRSTLASLASSSSCEAEVYAAAMADEELRWLSFLLTDLGERPHSPLVLFGDNRSTVLLCEEPRLVEKAKHIHLRFFLLRELQQRGQACVVRVVSKANTADIFTKALPPSDHLRFCTQLGLVTTCPHLLA
ncbi:unnamed protein product [Closterium sp. NIES-53]